MSVVPFPRRRLAAVLVVPEPLGGFYVVVRSQGWLCGSRTEALAAARRLAEPLGLSIRETGRAAA
jgi:hypothetical protein